MVLMPSETETVILNGCTFWKDVEVEITPIIRRTKMGQITKINIHEKIYSVVIKGIFLDEGAHI